MRVHLTESCPWASDIGCQILHATFDQPVVTVVDDRVAIEGPLTVECDNPLCDPLIDKPERVGQALNSAVTWARRSHGEHKN